MTLQVASELMVGFLLALVRTSAWMVACPPFNSNVFNIRAKIALAAGLALILAPKVGGDPELLTDGWAFIGAVAFQALTGLALGFAVLIIFLVVQAAGELIDLQSGFAAAAMYDPFTNASSTPIGRIYQLMATAILFALNGHIALVRGFMTSFEAAPLSGPRLDDLGRLLTEDLSRFLIAAIEIAAPVLAALFIADLVLGLVSRAAPQLNVMVIGFALKIGVVLAVIGLVLPLMSGVVAEMLSRAINSTGRLLVR
jgi:flagellar biosynthesis protein FliR